MPIGTFPESFSQAILVGVMWVGRLGVSSSQSMYADVGDTVEQAEDGGWHEKRGGSARMATMSANNAVCSFSEITQQLRKSMKAWRTLRRLEVCPRRCAVAGVSFSTLSLGWCSQFQHVVKSAENAQHSETAGHTYEGTPTTAWNTAPEMTTRTNCPKLSRPG